MSGRHRRPAWWRRHAQTVAPVAVGAACAATTVAASTPLAGPVPAIVSDVEATTGSLQIVTPDPYADPPTVRFSVPASVAAQALTAARETPQSNTRQMTDQQKQAETATATPTLSKKPPPSSGSLPQRIVAAAKSYVDREIPYHYGGKICAPSGGCDCSALVMHILRKADMDVPYRNSTALRRWAKPVSRTNAVPGDLVLFSGHVGVYAGDGMLIDHGGPGKGANYRKIWGRPSFGRIPS